MGASCCQKQIQGNAPLSFDIPSYNERCSSDINNTNKDIKELNTFVPISLKKPILLKLVQKTILRYSNTPTRANSNKSLHG